MPRRWASVAGALCLGLLIIAPARATAQRVTSSLSAGAVAVRYADESAVSALTLSPILTYATPRAMTGVAGTFSLADEGRWSSQGTLLASLLTSMSASGWLGELGGLAGGSVHADGSRTAQWLASARMHRIGASFSGWAGLGAGSIWDGLSWNGVQRAELGVTRRVERTAITATLLPTRAADTLRYADAEVAMEAWMSGRVVLRASLGGRLGAALPVLGRDERVWGDVGLTAWIAERTAVVAAVGTYPVDPTQGFPSGRFVSIALRVGGRAPIVLRRSSGEVLARREADAAGVGAFEARPLDGALVQVRVRASDARRVEITGDPTSWVPVALERAAAGWWTVVLEAGPGVHELVLRVDGGAWLVPPGLPVVLDEFGGRAGRLVIDTPR